VQVTINTEPVPNLKRTNPFVSIRLLIFYF